MEEEGGSQCGDGEGPAPMVSAMSEAAGKERKKMGHQRERSWGGTSCGKEMVRDSVVIDK